MPIARCDHCRFVLSWRGFPSVAFAWCPECGMPLKRTSARSRWPRVGGRPVDHDRGLEIRVARLPNWPPGSEDSAS